MKSDIRVEFDQLYTEFNRILLSTGMDKIKAEICGRIFAENTADGVVSHGINRFPSFIDTISNSIVDIYSEPELVKSISGIEQWDGKSGIGIINASKSTDRACELARKYGIGCVGLNNTNHWMRGGTYGLQGSEKGFIIISWTNTTSLMPPWGSAEKKTGNNPLVISIPGPKGPILLDMAMSQYSNGKLEVLKREGGKLPFPGGYDNNGELTTDPKEILDSQRALPIGFWKGTGLALVLDILGTIISSGDSTHEIATRRNETNVSQVFIAIDTSKLGSGDFIKEKIMSILDDYLLAEPISPKRSVRYPGQGMMNIRRESMENGILLNSVLWNNILNM